MTLIMEKARVDFLVQWQSLVVPPYRTVWRELNKHQSWRVTMVAPKSFREGGMQDLACAPNDPRNPALTVLPVKCWHTQVVWFKGLASTLRKWLKMPAQNKIFLCFAEPYSVTAIFGWLSLMAARLFTFGRSPRPVFLLFAFQNIYKQFPLPIRLIQSWMFRVSNAIFVPGVEHEEVLRRHGFHGRCIRFPMWIDAALFYSSPKPTDAKIRVGYAGSLLPEKGITHLLDAFIDNPNELRGCAFDVAGGGPLHGEVMTKIDRLKSAGVDVNFVGAVAVEKMPDFYRSLDLLIVPSLTASHWKEQFGRVIIEAMACGCVVIGSDSGEIPYVIADDRRIFPEGNIEKMRVVLRQALSEVRGNRNRLREQASDAAINKYADFNVARGLVENLCALVLTQ